jgi:hypothetical protein
MPAVLIFRPNNKSQNVQFYKPFTFNSYIQFVPFCRQMNQNTFRLKFTAALDTSPIRVFKFHLFAHPNSWSIMLTYFNFRSTFTLIHAIRQQHSLSQYIDLSHIWFSSYTFCASIIPLFFSFSPHPPPHLRAPKNVTSNATLIFRPFWLRLYPLIVFGKKWGEVEWGGVSWRHGLRRCPSERPFAFIHPTQDVTSINLKLNS